MPPGSDAAIMQPKLSHVLLAAALCFCANAGAQPTTPDRLACDRDARGALAPFVELEIAELRGFTFSKRQVDQLAQYLESPAGAAQWAGATQESRRQLRNTAVRAATAYSATLARLPFSPSTRYVFDEQFALGCADASHLVAQMKTPGFARFLALRAQVAAAAASWYAGGMFSKLAKEPAPIAAETSPTRAPDGASKRKGSKKTATDPRKTVPPNALAVFDSLLREGDMLSPELTTRQEDWLLGGATAAAPAALKQAAIEALSDAKTRAILRDPAYVAFHYAVAATAHKVERRLLQDYPSIEPLSRNVSQAWASDWLRPAPPALALSPKLPPPASAGDAATQVPKVLALTSAAAPANPTPKK